MQIKPGYRHQTGQTEQKPAGRKPTRWLLVFFLTSITFYGGAQIGSTLTIPGTNIGYIWPPVGIAIALMLLYGYRIWPAIAFAAFLSDLPFLISNFPAKTALLMAAGQTFADVLEIVLSVYLLNKIVGDRKIFNRVSGVFKFLLAIAISQIVSAFANIASLYLGEGIQGIDFWQILWGYWISNVVSILLLTPLIIIWVRIKKFPSKKQILSHLVFYLLTIAGTLLIFTNHSSEGNASFEYFTFLFVICAAFILGPNGVTAVIAIVASITIWTTSTGGGPYLFTNANDSLLNLEIYLATLAISGLIVSSVLSERNQSEASLRESEQLYRTLVKTMPEGIAVSDLLGNITFASDQLLTIYGSENADDAKNTNTLDWIAPESRDKAITNIQRLYQNDPPTDNQYTLLRKDGSTFFGEIIGSILYDNEDNKTGLVTIHRDITERKLSEDVLYSQVAFDKMLTGMLTRFASSPQSEIDSCVRTSLKEIAVFIGANQAFISMISADHKTWGITHEWHARELIGINTTASRIPFGTRPWAEAQMLAREMVTVHNLDDFPAEALDDRQQSEAEGIRSLLTIPMSSMDENVTGSVTLRSYGLQKTWTQKDINRFKMVVDTIASILERKQTQDALTQESEFNASMAELSQKLLVANSIQEIADITLQKALALTGSKIGVVGCIDRQTGLSVNPSLSSNIWGGYSSAASTDNDLMAASFSSLSAWVLQNRQPIITNNPRNDPRSGKTLDGNVITKRFLSVPGMHGDVLVGQISIANAEKEYSEGDLLVVKRLASIFALGIRHKQAEEEVHRLNMELEQRVLDRTRELEAANKELESFSYSVSHDLRAPLRAIDGLSRIAEDEFGESVPPEASRLISAIRSNTQRMGHLIEDLLKFSRLSRQPMKKELVNHNRLIEDALQTLADQRTGRQIEITIQSLPDSQGDPSLLLQVWINLLSNALKFTRDSRPAQIEVGVKTAQGISQVYYVCDNGVGFDMKYAGKLFGVFQRLHTEEEFEGTGVGLALVARIIQRHGGHIWAESVPNSGTTFYFTL